jgi:hypothetical protein
MDFNCSRPFAHNWIYCRLLFTGFIFFYNVHIYLVTIGPHSFYLPATLFCCPYLFIGFFLGSPIFFRRIYLVHNFTFLCSFKFVQALISSPKVIFGSGLCSKFLLSWFVRWVEYFVSSNMFLHFNWFTALQYAWLLSPLIYIFLFSLDIFRYSPFTLFLPTHCIFLVHQYWVVGFLGSTFYFICSFKLVQSSIRSPRLFFCSRRTSITTFSYQLFNYFDHGAIDVFSRSSHYVIHACIYLFADVKRSKLMK